MTAKKPYEPPTYGVRNLAIERRMAGQPPASEAAENDGEKAAEEPENKMVAAPANKAAAKRKAK